MVGYGFVMTQAHYIYCALYFYYYYLSSTSDHQTLDSGGWGTPASDHDMSAILGSAKLERLQLEHFPLLTSFTYTARFAVDLFLVAVEVIAVIVLVVILVK